jgi:hypothetical protein
VDRRHAGRGTLVILRCSGVALLCALVFSGCGREALPPQTRPLVNSEIAAELLKIELDTRALRHQADDVVFRHYTARLDAMDALLAHIARTARFLATGNSRAAEVGTQIAGVTYDLMRVDFEATIRGISGVTRRECNQGLGWAGIGIQSLEQDARWAERSEEVQQALQTAAWHRDNALRAAPAANVLKAGVTAASLTSGAISAVSLARSGIAALTRLSQWMEQGGATFGVLRAAPAGGGTIQLVTGTGALVLTPAEVLALANAGRLSATATALYMMARGESPQSAKEASSKPAEPNAQVTASSPATTQASVTEKLERYLLNPEHPVGRSKAQWFKEALGFTRENAGDLAAQIKFDPTRATVTELTPHGQKLNQVIPIAGANGRTIDVLFAWIRNHDGIVRLVTAIPMKK